MSRGLPRRGCFYSEKLRRRFRRRPEAPKGWATLALPHVGLTQSACAAWPGRHAQRQAALASCPRRSCARGLRLEAIDRCGVLIIPALANGATGSPSKPGIGTRWLCGSACNHRGEVAGTWPRLSEGGCDARGWAAERACERLRACCASFCSPGYWKQEAQQNKTLLMACRCESHTGQNTSSAQHGTWTVLPARAPSPIGPLLTADVAFERQTVAPWTICIHEKSWRLDGLHSTVWPETVGA